jgi:hypothetical protein
MNSDLYPLLIAFNSFLIIKSFILRIFAFISSIVLTHCRLRQRLSDVIFSLVVLILFKYMY